MEPAAFVVHQLNFSQDARLKPQTPFSLIHQLELQ